MGETTRLWELIQTDMSIMFVPAGVSNCTSQNGTSIDDKTFEANQKSDQANGVTYSKGTISDSTGVQGSYTHDPDIAGNPAANIAAMGNIGTQGMGAIKAFTVGSVVGGVTGGMGLSAPGDGAGLRGGSVCLNRVS
jgi:hypothetical protein